MMPPPGRRRGPSQGSFGILPLLTLILLAFVNYTHAQLAVIGIDVGTEYIKAALVKPGVPLDIVLTKDSKRKESAAIALKQVGQDASDPTVLPERLYGSDAMALAPRFPGDVFPNLKPLLGSLIDREHATVEYSLRYPALHSTSEGLEGKLGFKTSTANAKEPAYTVEELLAMQLSSVKANAEAMAGKGSLIRDSVITVPPFFTVDERRAIELSADLAGLRVMALLSDGLAVGLNYATSRSFPDIDKGEKPENHLIYDMGAGSTSATVVRFQSRTVKDASKHNKTIQEINVLGTGWDRSLGGDALNWLIVEDMVDRFIDSKDAKAQNIQAATVKSNGRAMAKLWRESERLRQVLSANSDTSGFFESFIEDIDFRYKISRAAFEKLAESLSDRISLPMTQALEGAGLQPSDLDSVVMHGGVVRTPFIQKQLEGLIGDAKKLRSNVNADESAVFGAAFKAAGLSSSFKVKDIQAHDRANYDVVMQWDHKGKPRRQTMFLSSSQVGVVKQVPLNTTEDITISFEQLIPNEQSKPRPISSIKMTNLTASQKELINTWGCTPEEINTQILIRLSPETNLPEINAAMVSCEVDPSRKKAGALDGVKGLFGFGGKKDQEPLVDAQAESASSSTTVIAEEKTAEANAASDSASATTPAAATPTPVKKQIKIIPLASTVVRTDGAQVSADKVTSMRERLLAFDASDANRNQRSEVYNALEAFTYRARDLLEDEGIIGVSTPAQRDEALRQLASATDWLHGDGFHAATAEISERLTQLKSLLDPMQTRRDETKRRPAALKELKSALNQTEIMLRVVQGEVDRHEAEIAAQIEAAEASIAAEAAAAPSGEDIPVQEGEDADLDPDATEPAKSSTKTKAAKPTSTPMFNAVDLFRLQQLYNSTSSWLSESEAGQSGLGPAEDPVLLSTDVVAKAEKLNEMLVSLVQKQQKRPSSKSSSKTSSKTSKSKSSKSSAKTESTSSASVETPSSSSTHGEL